jgi:Ca2+-binding EF-hand superfamily protein
MKSKTWKMAGLAMAFVGAASIAQAQGGGQGGTRLSREDMIKKYDTDGDGVLSDTERETMREAMKSERGGQGGGQGGRQGGGEQGAPGGETLSAADTIAKYDTDADGKLDATELETLMKAEQESRSRGRGGRGGQDMQQQGQRGGRGGQQDGTSREDMIKKYDKDGDGVLNDEERAALRADMQKRSN